jgi:hypothetical protein
MHAVVVRVTLNDPESAVHDLHEQVVPWATRAPGFVTGYWTRESDTGLSMMVFDSADAANAAAGVVRSEVPGSATLEDVEVREVMAHAG